MINVKGVVINEDDMNLMLFITDYAVWQHQSDGINTARQYQGAKTGGGMPLDLRQRLNNILMRYTGGDSGDI